MLNDRTRRTVLMIASVGDADHNMDNIILELPQRRNEKTVVCLVPLSGISAKARR